MTTYGIIRTYLPAGLGRASTLGTLRMFPAVTHRAENTGLMWKLPRMWSSVKRQAGPRRVFSQDSEWKTESDTAGTAAERMRREVPMDGCRQSHEISGESNFSGRKVWGKGAPLWSRRPRRGEKCKHTQSSRDQGSRVALETEDGSSPGLPGFLAVSSFTSHPVCVNSQWAHVPCDINKTLKRTSVIPATLKCPPLFPA